MERPTVVGVYDWAVSEDHANTPYSRRNPAFAQPYQVEYLSETGEVDLWLVPTIKARPYLKLRDVIEHRSGLKIDRALRGIPQVARADAVLAFLEPYLYAPAWLRRRHVWPYSRRPLFGISCWWAHEIANKQRDPAEVRAVMEGVDILFVFSANQVDVFREAGVPPEKIRPILFGVGEEFYRPAEDDQSKRFQVLAAGVDRGRDWTTLLAAARLLPDVRFDLFTLPESLQGLEPPPNLTVHPPCDIFEHQRNLQSAELVVVPTHDMVYPSGQSVLLEAMASGTSAAITRTAAMRDYIGDGEWNFALPLADPAGVAKVIRRVANDGALRARVGAAARCEVERRFSFHHMWATMRTEMLFYMPT